ncbi:hypothetical protein HG535_0D00700 [Zygotorulaspora mrakii]|uniref:Defect at low temperature protein 1 n=1 Tax=Zygotorulaspora mrakii TaxID=42260 RepID=A0A7H9B1F5_ZYGMR|nr:uncharacterized protein HG535_0D00700 [Zygotorulaspora mrakii]QLG72363.1 hypothetical protein HG535_0D00700 [Zygotorulaspora mrakii]
MKPNGRLKVWLYRGSLGITVLFLLGFSIVLPVDSIAQAFQSSNNAFNTFIVIGALVAFGVVGIVIVFGRILFYRSCIQDIPRRYIPIAPGDLPHSRSRNMILENMERSKDLSLLFKKPKHPVIHPGLEPPVGCDEPKFEKIFPEFLNYSTCIKSLADRLKYQGIFLNNQSVDIKLGDTVADVVRNQFMVGCSDQGVLENTQRFIDLYETIQFSGKEPTREQFIEFVSLAIYFVDLSSTRDKRQTVLDPNSNFQPEINFNGDMWNTEVSRIPTNISVNPIQEVDSYNQDSELLPEGGTYLRKVNSSSTVAVRMPSHEIPSMHPNEHF